MRILIDIVHPSDVHFFRNPIRILEEGGHQVLVTSRQKDCTVELLDEFGIQHRCLTEQNTGSLSSMALELLQRNMRLFRVARGFKPHVMAALGGANAAQVGRFLRIPTVVFYDTESARLQNALTYPFAHRIVVPECYTGRVPARKIVRYRGYHELSYLHPDYFQPSREVAEANGLAPHGDTFLVRLVSWQASHDIGQKGWSPEFLQHVVKFLGQRGRVVISAEGPLPTHLEPLRFSGSPGKIHHLMAYCRLCVGESATMASESVVLGVPALYAASASLGYIKDQERRYGLAVISNSNDPHQIIGDMENLLEIASDEIGRRHRRLIKDTVDVSRFAAAQVHGMGELR